MTLNYSLCTQDTCTLHVYGGWNNVCVASVAKQDRETSYTALVFEVEDGLALAPHSVASAYENLLSHHLAGLLRMINRLFLQYHIEQKMVFSELYWRHNNRKDKHD